MKFKKTTQNYIIYCIKSTITSYYKKILMGPFPLTESVKMRERESLLGTDSTGDSLASNVGAARQTTTTHNLYEVEESSI